MVKRDPLEDKLVVLIGGSGFLGAHVAQALLERGARVRIASRHPERAFKLKPLAQLGQLQFAHCDVAKPDTVRRAMQGADAAVYLVGAFKGDLDTLQAGGAEAAAAAAAEEGAQTFAYVSALGAAEESESGYARSKARGEKLVREAFPRATVLRMPMLFAEDHPFIRMVAGLVRSLRVVPVFAPHAPLAAIFVDDAADAVAHALADPDRHGGKTYELAGAEPVTMLGIHQEMARAQGRKRSFIEVPDAVSAAMSTVPISPLGRDQWIMLRDGNMPSGKLPGIEKFGIEPRPLSLFLERWMVPYRKHGRFEDKRLWA